MSLRHATRTTVRTAAALALGFLAVANTACVSMPSGSELDASFAAGWRPSKGYCTFGGETPTLDAYCAQVNFGADGLEMIARAVNENVLESAHGGPLPCTQHVAQVRAQLAAYPAYSVEELYSCDNEPAVEQGRSVCHVSLLVTDAASRAQIVLDNGHVLTPSVYGGVAPYREFVAMVDRHWTGDVPARIALAQ